MAEVEALREHANLFRRGGGLTPPAEVVVSCEYFLVFLLSKVADE
jgi:hypothetical protein